MHPAAALQLPDLFHGGEHLVPLGGLFARLRLPLFDAKVFGLKVGWLGPRLILPAWNNAGTPSAGEEMPPSIWF